MLDKYALIRAMKSIFTSPIKKFSTVELAKLAKLAPSAAKYTLDYMLANGMVTDQKVGRTHQYQTNLDSYLTRQWKQLFSLEEVQNSHIIENMLKQSKSITSIIVYGSVAEGRDDELSNIDILIIADVDKEIKKKILSQAYGTNRETNVILYTPMEWRRKAEKDKVFYENAILQSIVLYGQKPVVL